MMDSPSVARIPWPVTTEGIAMTNALIIQAYRFHSRRWETNRFWMKEIERNPQRCSAYQEPVEVGLTVAQQQAIYEYFKNPDMVMPTTRAGWTKMNWQLRRSLVDRRTKRVHVEKFLRDMFV
jgi:hypothetical protein